MRLRLSLGLALLLGAAPLVLAQPAPDSQPAGGPRPRSETPPPVSDKLSVVKHTLMLKGNGLAYTSTAGYLPLKTEDGKLRANIFFVAYTVDASGPSSSEPGERANPATQAAEQQTAAFHASRPITFVFNGGPGAAAVWLHMGGLGPEKILLGEGGLPLPPPTRLVDNANTWLPKTDMVFIDPVNTGYSRAATPDQAKEFFGVTEDAQAMAEFIRLYLTQNNRWASAKFLAGESYGTTRAAVLAEMLADRQGIALNGVILMSSVLNFASLHPGEGNDLPFALYLPTYAALAVYHGKAKMPMQGGGKLLLGDDALAPYLKEVESFALTDYATALNKGSDLPAKDSAAIVQKLVQYTGLSAEYIEKSNLRIDPSRFEKELLADKGLIIGRYDGRITAQTADKVATEPDFDPSFSLYLPVYESAFNMYVHDNLQYTNDLHYEVLSGRVQPWNFGGEGQGSLYVADDLRSAMQKNPSLKVFVAAGRYDLATPYFSADNWVSHMTLTPELRANVTQKYYLSGHMIYHEPGSIDKLHDDVMEFMAAAVK